MQTIKKIFELLNSSEKKEFYLLLLLIIFMAALDAIGIASILPFISILTNQDLIETNYLLIKLFNISKILGVNTTNEFILVLGILTFTLLVLSLGVKALTTYLQLRFTLMREYSIGRRLIEGYLHQPYVWFLNKNSANISKNILSEINLVLYGSIIPTINLIAQSIVTFSLFFLLLLVDPILTVRIALVLGFFYFLIFIILKKFINKIGSERVKDNDKRFNVVSEAFGAIKYVKSRSLENTYIHAFEKPAKNYAKNLSLAQIFSQLPRYFLEGIIFGGFCIIISLLVFSGKDFNNIIPIIAIYAFAGYRLIPAIQQIYGSITQINFSRPALNLLHRNIKELNYPKYSDVNSKEKINLKKELILKNVCFNYPETKMKALNNIKINISAFSKIGIVGSTGSGKTTLIDIILGLLDPQQGNIIVDDKIINRENLNCWQKSIGYVPQQIYLSDETVTANIAFGVSEDKIDYQAIEKSAKIANIHDFIVNQLPNGYSTLVGERGVRLSGGQKQRIGIARALYHNPELLILDEATSSLDNLTEQLITESINKLNKNITIIIIAHRLNTIKNCDKIFFLDKGIIKSSGKYEDLLIVNEDFKKMSLIQQK